MGQNYLHIRNDYLKKAWARSPMVLSACLPAELQDAALSFQAFGEACLLTEDDITLAGAAATGPEGLLIALYASVVPDRPVQLEALKSFKELPDSMSYQAAFAAHAEQSLVPWVTTIHRQIERLVTVFSGQINLEPLAATSPLRSIPCPGCRCTTFYICRTKNFRLR